VRSAARPTKRNVAIVLALALVVALVVTGVTSGFNDPTIPSDDVAVVDGVDGGTISQDQFNSQMEQNAKSLGLKSVPAQDDPQYTNVVGQTMQSLLQIIWIKGEAEDRGITVSSDDVDAELEKTKKQQFSSEKQFQQYLKQNNLTLDQAREQIETSLLTNKLVSEVAPSQQQPSDELKPLDPQEQVSRLKDFYGITDSDVENFYDANITAFQKPASREARVILNKDQAKLEQAKKELEAGNFSDETWNKVAKKFSEDQTSSASGGQLPAPITEGSGDPLEKPVFDAPVKELSGPTKTDRGYFLIYVTKATDASTTPLDDKSRQQIEQQLVTNEQARVFAEFKDDFFTKWTARTYCKPEAVMEYCSNFEPPANEPTDDPSTPDVDESQVTPPAVSSIQPIEPGTATIPLNYPSGYAPAQGQSPQGPGAGVQLQTPGGVPAGAVPVTPGAAPTGAAPTGAAPTGAAPTGAAPTGAAPTP
jgi:parvulin-like peptidyl-prolyl isomerase